MFRRSEPRASATPEALIRTNGAEHGCEILDLSERGARLLASAPLPDRFELVIDKGPVRSAQVRWRREDQIGVSFGPREPGDEIPPVQLALAQPPHATVDLRQLVDEGRSVLVGVVGAFAPERLQIHRTEIHARAGELRRSGFARLLCVAPNDPWTVKAWADIVDPERRLTYLSDAYLELGRWFGATYATSRRRHLGVRPRSYLAVMRSRVIERLIFNDFDSSLVFEDGTDTP